jgi:hypothetical protein
MVMHLDNIITGAPIVSRFWSIGRGDCMKSDGRSLSPIIKMLREELPDLRHRYCISYLGVFGSYLHGEHGTRRDLDILVDFSGTPSMFKFLDLEGHLSKLLGVKFDLVMKNSLKPRIDKNILEEAVSV